MKQIEGIKGVFEVEMLTFHFHCIIQNSQNKC